MAIPGADLACQFRGPGKTPYLAFFSSERRKRGVPFPSSSITDRDRKWRRYPAPLAHRDSSVYTGVAGFALHSDESSPGLPDKSRSDKAIVTNPFWTRNTQWKMTCRRENRLDPIGLSHANSNSGVRSPFGSVRKSTRSFLSPVKSSPLSYLPGKSLGHRLKVMSLYSGQRLSVVYAGSNRAFDSASH
jgi:hypothetical protein